MINHINLMTPRAQVRECTRARLRQWSLVLAATVVALVLHGAICWWPVHIRSEQRAALESQYEPLRLMKLENKQLSKSISETLNQSQLELALSQQTPVVTLIGLVGQVVGGSEGEVFLDTLEFTQPEVQETAQRGQSIVKLAGITAEPAAAGEFADRLKHTLDFAEVQVGAVEGTTVNNHSMHVFHVEFSF